MKTSQHYLFTIILFCLSFLFGTMTVTPASTNINAEENTPIDWPEEMPGIHATRSEPDTVLMYKYADENFIRVGYYHAGHELGECDSTNYPNYPIK